MVNITFIYEHKIYSKIYENKEFTFKEVLIDFTSEINYDINDLYFFYKGKYLLEFNNKIIKKDIKILICNIKNRKKNKINYNYVLCPECKKLGYMNIKNNIISITCLNKHSYNLSINEFINNQIIKDNKIKCFNCGNNKSIYGKFYLCSCNNNICPLCSQYHLKEHKIIDYDKKYNICIKHYQIFISYCVNCDKNLCPLCEIMHFNHKIYLYKEIKLNKKKEEEIKNDINTLNLKMNNKYKLFPNIKYFLNKTLIDYENKYKDYIEIYKILIYYLENMNNYETIVNMLMLKSKKLNKDLNFLTDGHNNNLLDFYDKMNNELVLTYHLKKEKSENSNYELFNENIDNFANNNENKKIRLFGKEFVSNNKNKCFLIINNKKSELVEYYYLNNKEKINDKLVIKYIEKEKLTDMSYMFSGCKNLLSISNALKWDISEVSNISYLFSYCESLKYLPDILSYWDTSNLTNMNNIFSNCLSLNSIPDISGWKTSKIIKMKDIFFNCKSLKSIPNISNWNLSNIKFIKDYINEQNFLENKKDLLLDNYLGKYDLQLKSNCICKIKGSEYGLGIFCKIPIDKIVLLTSYKVLNEKYLLATKDIIIKLNSRIKIMNKKDRRIWCNAKLNYTCIEILEEDYIQDFYYLDENLINDNLENYYKNNFIILISLFENKKIGISNGLIINSKMDNLIYSDDSFQKFSEGFIINQQNNCIIGIHKEKYIISKEKNENKNI